MLEKKNAQKSDADEIRNTRGILPAETASRWSASTAHPRPELLDQLMPEAEQTVEGNYMRKLE